MNDSKMNNLAETLSRTGLAFSAADAMRIAESIITTEQKVSGGITRYEKGPTKYKSYQEEIDDLIRKTSPEYKQYHVPVKGYSRENSRQEAQKVEIQTEQKVFFELEEPEKPVAVECPEPVDAQTDILDDNTPLTELMESAAPEPAVDGMPDISISEKQEMTAEADEFIIPVNPGNEEKKAQPEQLFKEIKEDKSQPRAPRNPIESVDLMDFFKVA